MMPALDLGLRAAVLLAAGLAAVQLLGRASAAVRHRVLAASVALTLLLPLAALVAPRWSAAWMTSESATAPQPPTTSSTSAPASATAPAALGTTVRGADPARRGATIALAVWAFGTLLSLTGIAAGLVRLRRLSRRATIDSGVWTAEARRIAAGLGLVREVRVLHGSRADLLVAWGWRRPSVLLPPGAATWSAERRRIVLAHELAHLVRGDAMVQLAADVMKALYWFNPLAWYTSRRLRLESECACDDQVLADGVSASEYASHLVAIARDLQSNRSAVVPAPAMARPTSLEGRVRAMLTRTRDRRPVSVASTLAIAVAGGLLTLAVAGAQSAFVPVSGTIVDPSGRILPNVQVSLTEPASSARFEVRTDSTGRYQFAGVPPADYLLEAKLPGFEPAREPLPVTAAATRDVQMNVGTLQETITVRQTSAPDVPGDLAERRAKAREQFDSLAEKGAAPCRASGPPAVGGNIMAPRKLIHVGATYPEELRSSGVGGSVRLMALIGVDGTVREVRDLQGPHPALEAAAADAVRQWQFSPTFLNCQPIDVQMTVTTNFVP